MFNSRPQPASAPKTKAASFGALSTCAGPRVPSRLARRSSITCAPGGDPTSDHWTPRRSSQARFGRISRTRVYSGLSISTSVQNLARIKPCPFPAVSTLARPTASDSRRPSLLDRARRVPSTSRYPPLHVHASADKYTLDIALPVEIKPEMVTITTAKGDRLKIVADVWHLESDCHYEWEIVFPPEDVQLSTIRAKFSAEGHLSVSAGRRRL
ncbi:hypothetical protein FB45DRAFT_834338 [Roridomyces roridus]|uniref:SHSP domain-containing protein n=1 Tax=Roridomyces roridus TaxID=1738132 RepID=A0AAD7BRB8_9AGAR|nr:hypothetical protein FB45DRAFT_834338 [Roridomyces roridus]